MKACFQIAECSKSYAKIMNERAVFQIFPLFPFPFSAGLGKIGE